MKDESNGWTGPDAKAVELYAPMQAQYARQAGQKRAAGRYTLEEASAAIAEHNNERNEVMRAQLEAAARKHELHMYEPVRNARIEYGAGQGKNHCVRIFYEECYWNDLNKWLEDNEPRLQYRFPAPADAQAEQNEQSAPAKPLQRNVAQDAAMLSAIKQARYDPLALPENEPGKAGVKSEIRKLLNDNPLFFGTTIFDRTWERLRRNGEIATIPRWVSP